MKFSVAYTGLKNGVHSFTYLVDRTFFEARAYSPVKSGDVEVELEFDKRDTFFVLGFRFGGLVNVHCDRCTADVTLPVNGAASLLVKFENGESYDVADDEVMYISPKAIEVDFSQFLYENIIVNVPLYKTCDDDISGKQACNEKVLNYLENGDKSGSEEIDPRWNKLKQLKIDKDGTS
ncbi:MAG: DUF177 domain-containing protein [Saprospiraceae bacterium]|nr:DUF177 domain-containing protein [Saprospiraceae bacterium]